MHRAPGEITLCSDLLLVSGRRLHSADVATINILQTHAPNRSRAGHIRSCGARWYVHSLNNRSQNTTSHLARLSIRTTLSCLASHLLVHSRQFGVDLTFEVGEYPDTALDRSHFFSTKASELRDSRARDCKELEKTLTGTICNGNWNVMEEPWSGAGSARLTPVSGWEKGSLMSVSKKEQNQAEVHRKR